MAIILDQNAILEDLPLSAFDSCASACARLAKSLASLSNAT